MGVANGIATLDDKGLIHSNQLPSYVDDIIECYATYTKNSDGTITNIVLYNDKEHTIIINGQSDKIYLDITESSDPNITTQYQFRWSGTKYSVVGAPTIIGEVTGTAFDGGRGKKLEQNVELKQDKINSVSVNIDNNTGVPEADVSFKNGTLDFQFRNLKGKSLTYEDLTEDQIYELQYPALNAATNAENAAGMALGASESALAATQKSEEATSKAIQATQNIEALNTSITQEEQTRIQQELLRQESEKTRVEAESVRQQNFQQLEDNLQQSIESASTLISETEVALSNAETANTKATQALSDANLAVTQANKALTNAGEIINSITALEDQLEEKESERNSQEESRIIAEQSRVNAENSRVQVEQARTVSEQQRKTSEQNRTQAESSRESAEQNRASAEQQRVTEFAKLKQDAETATTNANEAAQKANQAASGITDRLSETYPNFAAIQASGETNQDKIYIDAETNTSYRYNGSEFVSIGGGNQSEPCYGVSYNKNVIISDELANYINSCEAISVLFAVKCQTENPGWRRYIQPLIASNSNSLRCLWIESGGKVVIFSNETYGNSDLKYSIKGYKNIISIDRIRGKSTGYNEVGEFYNVTLDRLKQPDFFVGNNLKIYMGDYNNAYIDYIIFNFDVSKIAFNPILLNYLRNIEKTGIIPQEFIHDSWSIIEKEKHVPNIYGEQWNRTLETDGYYYKDIDQTKKSTSISSSNHNNWISNKAYMFKIRIEVLEGSIRCLSPNNIHVNSTAIFREVINVNTEEVKTPSEDIGVGTWDIIVDSIQEGGYGIYIESAQVPAKIKCIKQTIQPYAAVLQLNGDALYDGNKVYDTISKKMIQVNGATPGTLPFKSARYGTSAPPPSDPPRFIGEKYYNTTTGDIYEAGNLTTFKKLNDA